MLSNLDTKGISLKVVFDGYDFSTTSIGEILIPNKDFIKSISYSEDYSNWKQFLDYVKCDIPYINNLKGYHTGIYKLKQSSDVNNPWKDRQYILFNNTQLNILYERYPEIRDLEFYVCPAFYQNNCIGLGFRVINQELIQNAFKWLFMSGNNIIYGLDDAKSNCYVVEGFRDYVALKESGYNVIGLGSVFISKYQEQVLDTLNPILLLDNDKFGLKQTLNYRNKYRIATLIQTIEKDAWDTYSKGIPIKIMEIK